MVFSDGFVLWHHEVKSASWCLFINHGLSQTWRRMGGRIFLEVLNGVTLADNVWLEAWQSFGVFSCWYVDIKIELVFPGS